jgi:2-polyprenyl-3-methyl-5-hydroxy-6-metoxy-1,4-benzoquinol methylase
MEYLNLEENGITKFDGSNIYGYGNVRLVQHYYKYLIEPEAQDKTLLDIGCGDGVVGTIVQDGVSYHGVDIGAGIYSEKPSPNVRYIRDYNELLNEILNSEVDISMLMNVLEHTFDFTGLFEAALKSTKSTVVVSLPNEENVHNRLDFLFGRGVKTHTLDLVDYHVNHRHLWLIQIPQAVKALSVVAQRYGFTLSSKLHYVAYPNTLWKRVFYRAGMVFLPWTLKARNFVLIFRKL